MRVLVLVPDGKHQRDSAHHEAGGPELNCRRPLAEHEPGKQDAKKRRAREEDLRAARSQRQAAFDHKTDDKVDRTCSDALDRGGLRGGEPAHQGGQVVVEAPADAREGHQCTGAPPV